MFTNRYFLGSLTFSFVLHLGILGLVKFYKPPVKETEMEQIQEVTFYDPSQRPEVATAMGRGGGGTAAPATSVRASGGGGGGGGGGGSQAYMPAIPGYKDLSESDVAPDAVAHKLSGTQVNIDASRYVSADDGMDVIHLADKSGGKTASTEDILAAPALALARGVAGSGGGGGGGYAQYLPGGAGNAPTMQPEDVAPAPAISQADLNKRIERSRSEVVEQQAPAQEKIAAAPTNKPSVTISGQISGRKRVRCGLPRYPDWAVKQGASGTVVVKLFVAADGSVRENLTIESTSGYPALDELVANALKGWQFGPLDPGVAQEDQWGKITVRFVLG
jgi:TonB family protein